MRAKLKAARKAAGLTQQAVADRLGVSVRQYMNIEAGVSIGKVSMWDSLEDMLGVNQRVLRAMYPGKADDR